MTVWRATPAIWLSRGVRNIIRAARSAQARRHARCETRSARGITLLRAWLSLQQNQQLEYHNYFEVTGCDSGKRYRIQHGMCQNVFELDSGGRPRMGWCFVPQGNLVPGDVMLAQKIALETDERGALSIAKQFLVPPLSLFGVATT